jgi:hypothetical protein
MISQEMTTGERGLLERVMGLEHQMLDGRVVHVDEYLFGIFAAVESESLAARTFRDCFE